MKKLLTFVAMALLLVGCAKEYDDSGLRELISGLDTRITALESSVQALQSAIGEGVFVAKVQEYADPDTGKTIGVTVTYTNGDVKYFEITPKADYDGPVLGVIKNGAGQLVWAIDGVAIMVDDEYVTVYQTPVFSIDDDGNLWVSIDGQDPVNLGPVTTGGATLVDGIFTDIKVEQDKVVLTLSDNSVVNIPFAEAFKLNIDATKIVFSELEPIEIPYTVSAKTAGTVVGVAGYNPWMFSVAVEEDKIVVTPFSANSAGVFLVYADSKIGLTSMVNISIEAEVVEVVDEPVSEDVNYIADGEDGVVVANVVSNVEFDVNPLDEWIHVTSVKAQVYQITLSLDNNTTGALRTGAVQLTKKGSNDVIQTIIIAQNKAEEGIKNLSKKGPANSYIVKEAGDYMFWAVKGNSDQSVGEVAKAEIVWETYNNADEVTANSVIAKVAYANNYIVFSTPETLKPGNALIAAKDANDKILWSWHIWIPATEVANLNNGVFSSQMMDRNLGALVAATAGAEAPVESFGLTYQWGRKDPFVGPKAVNSSSNAVVAGVELSATEGSGEADESKISLQQSIENPTLLGHAKNGDWLLPADNELWKDAEKTIYDPCPPGYRVPALTGNTNFFSEDASAATGWVENASQYHFAMGDPLGVFPFAGYRDDYGPASMTHAYDRVAYWSSSASSDAKAAYLNVRAGSAHAKADAGKSRAGSVRCVAFDESGITPPDPGFDPEPGGSVIDLSKDGNANCYIVEKAGDFKFKAVKGNGTDAVAAASVELLWETNNTATAPEANSIIAKVGFGDGFVTFSTPETLVPGNAVIAAKDGEGVILWSWHIWIPKDAVSATDLTDFIGGSMMNMNLGALEVVPATGSATIANLGLLYQWGRKDPFTGAADWGKYPARAKVTPETAAWAKSEGKVSIEEAIKNPTTLYIDAAHSDDHDWNSTSEANLWDNEGKKTIYDPCPVGYKVPVKTGSIWTKTDEGWNFDVENHVCEYTSNGVRIPLAGYVECYGGSLYGAGGGEDHTYVWSATHHDTERGECMYVRTSKDPGSKYYKAYRGKGNAASIRCIAE